MSGGLPGHPMSRTRRLIPSRGICMNSKRLLSLLAVLAIFPLATCSGVKGGGGGGGGGTGTGNVIVTVTSTPSTTFSFPYLEWVILSVDLINSSGTATIVVQGALPPLDFARLQTDSQFLGIGKSIPAGTYTSAKNQ